MNVSNSLKSKGFTLTELLIVIGIMAILFAFSAPIILRQVEKGLETKARNTMKDLSTAIFDYSADNHGFLPTNGVEDSATDDLLDTATDKFFVARLSGASDIYNNHPGKAYFLAPPAKSDKTYGFVGTGDSAWLADPWGRGYIILVDYSGDESLTVADNGVELEGLDIYLSGDELDKTLSLVAAPLCRGGRYEENDAGQMAYIKYLLGW